MSLRGQGTFNETNEPIMAHPPHITSDITLAQWLDDVIENDQHKGIKLDFKYTEALGPALKLLRERKDKFQQPVWINADVFVGPNSTGESLTVNASEFKRIVLEYFPECTLSLGWKTGSTNDFEKDEVYTQEMIDHAIEYTRDLQQPITFAIRAAMLRKSWDVLQGLLNESRRFTLTVWSAKTDIVDPDELVYVWKTSEIDRVYYDLPETLMAHFQTRLIVRKYDLPGSP